MPQTTPSAELLKAVRVKLLLRDVSLTVYAGQRGVKRQNLTKALLGVWRGPTARLLVQDVLDDLDEDEDEVSR